MSASPLAGVRVIDIASLYAAPFAATLMGDFGAEVIKIEPPEGDSFRGTGMWSAVGRNKKSVVLDLRAEAGCADLRKLLKNCDVLVQNFPREFLARRGLDWNTLSALNPRLIMLSVSCFGQTGPYAGRPGAGTIGEGFAGLTDLTGKPDEGPMLPSVALGDGISAMSAVIGTLAALYWRDAGGGTGQEVDVSLYEPVLQAITQALAQWQKGKTPRRMGGRLMGGEVRNTYATADGGHVVISANMPRHLRELAELAGMSAGCDKDAAVAGWMRTLSLDEALRVLVERRIPHAPVNDIDRILADPHVQARQSLIMKNVNGQPVPVAAPHPLLSRSPGAIQSMGSALGAYNAEFLGRR